MILTFPTFKHAPGQDYPGDDTTSYAGHKRRGSANPGVDFGTPIGTAVYAPARIRITETWPRDTGSGGLYVRARVLEDDGTDSGFVILCLHLSEILCSVGDVLERGELFARTGASGGVVRHLHFTLILNGTHVDPMLYLVDEVPAAEAHTPPPKKGKQTMRIIKNTNSGRTYGVAPGFIKHHANDPERQIALKAEGQDAPVEFDNNEFAIVLFDYGLEVAVQSDELGRANLDVFNSLPSGHTTVAPWNLERG